jgi:hypothetical protein
VANVMILVPMVFAKNAKTAILGVCAVMYVLAK